MGGEYPSSNASMRLSAAFAPFLVPIVLAACSSSSAPAPIVVPGLDGAVHLGPTSPVCTPNSIGVTVVLGPNAQPQVFPESSWKLMQPTLDATFGSGGSLHFQWSGVVADGTATPVLSGTLVVPGSGSGAGTYCLQPESNSTITLSSTGAVWDLEVAMGACPPPPDAGSVPPPLPSEIEVIGCANVTQ